MITTITIGIGAAAAILFAEHGAKVVVTDIDATKSQSVVDTIKASGGDAISVPGDVTAKEFPATIIKATIEYVVTTLICDFCDIVV
jgi:3-oxoacyl-[acyl-carrier protein] reductase